MNIIESAGLGKRYRRTQAPGVVLRAGHRPARRPSLPACQLPPLIMAFDYIV